MENDIQQDEKTYTTKEIATLLDMAISTVRKYAQHLEKAGHFIIKTESKARLFTDNDIMVLRYLKDLRDNTNITVEQATSIVVEKFNKNTTKPISTNNTVNTRYEERLSEMENQLLEQSKLIKKLTLKLEENEKQGNRRDDILIQSMKKLIETQKRFIQENKKRKHWFVRLFDKSF